MKVVTEPSDVPNEKYHTLEIEKLETGDFSVIAQNNNTVTRVFVGSVGIAGESAGMLTGSVTFDAADSWIVLDYVDFNEEYGYDEVQVMFEER